MLPRSALRLFALLAFVLATGVAQAADVKVFISAGFFHVYSELRPAFEKAIASSPHAALRSATRRKRSRRGCRAAKKPMSPSWTAPAPIS